jgi:Bacterial pre-peptidase C-terminal domain
MKVFTMNVPAGRRLVIRTSATSDLDLYAKVGPAPTTAVYDGRALTARGTETLNFIAPAGGVLHSGVFGHRGGAFKLTTANE